MEEHVKSVLYSYPKLKGLERGFEEHIFTRAMLSFDNRRSGEKAMVKMAEDILKKRRLVHLQEQIEQFLGRLSSEEQLLLELRYFRRKRKIKAYLEACVKPPFSSERSYYRKQAKLLEKVVHMFERSELKKDKFWEEYADLEELRYIFSHVEKVRPTDLVERFLKRKRI